MTGTRPRLSAVIVARNEAARLPDCLRRLTFADELVVALDRTTDDSRAIAERFGARVIEGAWELEGDRRNAALAVATGDWCLEIDADEWVPSALADEIRALLDKPAREAAADAHWLPVDNYVAGRLIRHGWGASFGVAAVARLTRRGTKLWGRERVHPRVTLGRRGGRLATPLIHHVDRSVSDMWRRLDRYAEARAADLRDAWAAAGGRRGRESLGRNLGRFVTRAWKCYVGRKGYREGNWGVLIALCAGLYPLLAYLKAVLEPVPGGPNRP